MPRLTARAEGQGSSILDPTLWSETVEVIPGGRRRRNWSEAEKARIVAESADAEANVSEAARRNDVSRSLLKVWRRQARLGRRQASGTRARKPKVEPSATADKRG
jgi:transposase-like protein